MSVAVCVFVSVCVCLCYLGSVSVCVCRQPCGTCTSWLQKIVKCNPDFRVVTFTDARRQGIYVEYIQE